MLYPKHQIKINQYTRGGEFIVIETNENYKGPYWSTSRNEYYIGENPSTLPKVQLKPIKQKFLPEEEVYDTTQNYYITDIDYEPVRKNMKKEAPRKPRQSFPKPTPEDYTKGEFTRYFVKKGNENRYIEVSKIEYTKFESKDELVDYNLYIPFSLKWMLKGDKQQVYLNNRATIIQTQQPGFINIFKEKYAKFWRPE